MITAVAHQNRSIVQEVSTVVSIEIIADDGPGTETDTAGSHVQSPNESRNALAGIDPNVIPAPGDRVLQHLDKLKGKVNSKRVTISRLRKRNKELKRLAKIRLRPNSVPDSIGHLQRAAKTK